MNQIAANLVNWYNMICNFSSHTMMFVCLNLHKYILQKWLRPRHLVGCTVQNVPDARVPTNIRLGRQPVSSLPCKCVWRSANSLNWLPAPMVTDGSRPSLPSDTANAAMHWPGGPQGALGSAVSVHWSRRSEKCVLCNRGRNKGNIRAYIRGFMMLLGAVGNKSED